MTTKTNKDIELEDVKQGSNESLLEGTALNDSTRVKKRPARERLQQLKVLGGLTRPGYVRRWVADKPTSSQFGTNIKDKECLGYTVVTNEEIHSDREYASIMGSVVEKKESDGARMVLMEISCEDYDELQAAKAEMRQNNTKALEGTGFYNGNLKITKN